MHKKIYIVYNQNNIKKAKKTTIEKNDIFVERREIYMIKKV